MRDGDVYFWRWKEGSRIGVSSPYHCWSRIAVADGNGRLRDQFWSDNTDKIVPTADADLTYRGNIHEMKKIPHYEAQFYRDEDVVDMRHSNNSTAPVYVVVGAERDSRVMRALVIERIEKARQTIAYQTSLIDTLNDEIAAIDDGRLHNVVPR
jgi:hypothetical protein